MYKLGEMVLLKQVKSYQKSSLITININLNLFIGQEVEKLKNKLKNRLTN